MLEIIKYQLKGRKNSMLLLLSIFGIVNLVAYAVEAVGIMSGRMAFGPAAAFWIPISIGTTFITTVVMFFKCGTGHVNELLYKDSSYLMLTVPRRGWEVLGGRLVAGLIEYLAYGISCAVLLGIHGAFAAVLASRGETGFFRVLGFMFEQVFVLNFFPMLQIGLIMLFGFVTTGIFITFAVVGSRSFVKNRGIATAVSIAVFMMLTNWSMQLGTFLSEKLGWFANLRFALDSRFFAGTKLEMLNLGPPEKILALPVAPFLFFLVLAAILFAGASWLMEKKVEL